MVASFDKAIPPGQEGEITLKIGTRNRKGKFRKSSTVYSNDPLNPKTKIFIECFVKQYESVKPNSRINVLGYEGEKIKKKLIITSLEEQSFAINKKEITSDIEDKIKYKLKTVEDGKSYSLEIENRSDEEGMFRGEITLKTNSLKKPLVVIHVYYRLRKTVVVKPKHVLFKTIDINDENFDAKSLTRSIVLKDISGKVVEIKDIKPSKKWIRAETKVLKEGKQYSIIISLDKDNLPEGVFKEEIDIRTNYKKKNLVIPVKGEVI